MKTGKASPYGRAFLSLCTSLGEAPMVYDYVVTGAAGFIGRALIEKLRIEQPSANILQCDLLEPFVHPDELRGELGFSRPKAIYHLGALSYTDNDDSHSLQRWNIESSLSLIELARFLELRLIYASSAATYGDGEHGFSDDWETTQKLKPLSKYAWSKQVVDEYCIKSHGEQPHITGCKFFNVFGRPHQEQHKRRQRSMVTQLWETAHDNKPARLFSPGWQYRDFVWIDDIVSVLRWLEYNRVPGLLNIGTGEPWSFVEVATACYRKQKKPLEIQWTEIPANLEKQYQLQTKADISKLRRYGYDKPFVSVLEALGHFQHPPQS